MSVPDSIGNIPDLGILTLYDCPILPRGDTPQSWGREELVRDFGDRVSMDDPIELQPMPRSTTLEQVYGNLDTLSISINRDTLKATQIPEIPSTAIEDGDEFLEVFYTLLTTLNFGRKGEAGYLSYVLLAGDYASKGEKDTRPNDDKIFDYIIPRLTGYFKTLYDLPLDANERRGWQMYEENKPALKKALSFIITTLNKLDDPDQRAQLFLVFVDGMLHCPTGQKEGIDTVVLSLLGGKVISGDISEMIKQQIALKKNAYFKTAILAKGVNNTQNVHLISTYEGELKDVLGLSNILGYKEKMDMFGQDPFSGNPANVVHVYYELLPVQRMVDWVMEKVQTPEESQQAVNLMKLQGAKQVDLGKIVELEAKVRANELFHPISYQVVQEYLLRNRKVDMTKKDWWKGYLTADPTLKPAALSREGALRLLIALGYVIAPIEEIKEQAPVTVLDPEDINAMRFMIE